ncbi:hypothetical protein [Niabella drilacis]|uniref:MG2 domain-containing protein n=1 Tax=Niabella drilacis (strain DSM 25811 / CCM 8410 / CCUG 62505 / LMG 26954 / E90) TaxID=1285928 RepID=A0A1G6JE77_NIADE|nr:hypothetical protein [Niabella drilacis]SDC16957.1 hypothetical protein SAMN04487894_101508 [Niabella drilacis]
MTRFLKPAAALLIILGAAPASGQDLTTRLETWNEKNPIEKAYLHLDRETYFSGQTIWFKAYFMSGFLPSAANSTLFVELLNNQSALVIKKIVPVFGALSYGQFDLPDSLPTGSYQLRAYTPLMLNFDKAYLFSQRVMVYGRNKLRATPPSVAAVASLRFFPEGGNLVSGLPNNIAFRATDPNGLPVSVSGEIRDETDKVITTFTSSHDGMGQLILTPSAGRQYHASVKERSFELPQSSTEGLVLRLTNNNNAKAFTLDYRGSRHIPAYMVGQMQHHIVLKQALTPSAGNRVSGIIQTTDLPSGVLQVTFFNKDGMPLAERLTFINNKEYILPATFKADTLNNGARKKNHFSIGLPDSITGNFSVSVTDADYEAVPYRPQNIYSTFLLTSDIPGYVHEPRYYFSNTPTAAAAVELVMLTNGWRRFKWTDVAANTLPPPLHRDPGFISLSGKATITGSGRSFADRDLLVWVATDSGRSLQMVKTDPEGRFKMDSMIFFNKAKVLFSDVMGKKNKFLTIKLNTDSLTRSYALPPLQLPLNPKAGTSGTLPAKMSTAYFDYARGEGLMLDSVVVQGTKTRLQKLEERYMSGLFAGGINARTLDLTREFIPNMNIFDYLQGRIPSLTIERGGRFGNYRLFYRQSGARQPMQLYLDEVPADADMIASIPSTDIALVKVFPNFIGAAGGGANGVLAVYTKRGDELNNAMESSATIVDYEGYSIMKEFYAPDYSTPAANPYNDYRLTLDWKPEIFVSGNAQRIPIIFYNNDRTKRFKVVAEGITSTGKLLMLEQYVERGN